MGRVVPGQAGLRILLAGLLVLPWASPVQAQEGDFFRPLVFANYGYDDNIFRVQDEFVLPSGFKRGDTYHQLGLGFELDWKPGRQRVRANARVNQTRFSDNSALLDYDGQDIDLTWDWQLGNLWSGQLGYDRQRTLGSFLNAGLVNNVRTEDSYFFNANYRFHSRWQAGLGFRHYANDYSAVANASSNVEMDTATLGLYYRGGTLDRLGVETRLSDGEYPQRPTGGSLATAFDERFVGGVADWTVTGKSRVRARLGYVTRDNRNGTSRDHSGLEWRLDGDWTPTGKTLINVALNREINHTDLTNANDELATGLEVNAYWLVRPKTRLGAGLSYRNVDYEGANRTDDILSLNLNASYEIWRGGDISAQIRNERRASTVTSLDNTNSLSFFLGALLKF